MIEGCAGRHKRASFYIHADLPHIAPVSTTVLLARHASHAEIGRVLSGRSEIMLSDAGRAEADRLADRLAAMPLAAIHSSPRRRARETAEAVARRRGMDVTMADPLDEIDFGGWAGQSFAALEGDPLWADWNGRRGTAATAGGETMARATARAVRHIEAAGGDGPLLCVSHADIIRGIVAHYLGLDADRLLRFDIDPASLTTLSLHGGRGRLVAINERAA